MSSSEAASARESAESVQRRLKSLQTVVLAMGAALPIIGVVGLVVLPPAELVPVHLAITVGIGAAGAILAHLMTGTLVKPLDRDERDPVGAGMTQLHSATFTQMALAEAGGMVVLALGFVLGINPILVLIGTIVSSIGVFAVAWPARGRLRRVRRRLEFEHASCPLDELAERRT